MKILFQCRKNLNTLSGGDKIQILNTKKYLKKNNVEVIISTDNEPDLKNIDVFHLFNPSLASLEPIKKCKEKNIPVVISTIHWDMKEYYQSIFKINKNYFKLKPKSYLKNYLINQFWGIFYNYFWYPKNMRDIKKILQQADLLLPNSQAEADLIKKQFNLTNCRVIPNGIDLNISQSTEPQDFILCVGRLEYRKNQFLLIKSLMDTEIPLVFIGNNKFNHGYTSLCKKLAAERGNVKFIDHLEQNQLYSYYSQAKVHALISWYETPGLASLEAGQFGCNLVVSDKGSTREYFKEHAHYCDPQNLDSIKKAVLTAYQEPRTAKLKNYLAENFTWAKAAAETLAAYQSIATNKK